MSGIHARLPRVLFALAVAGGLAFGARSAFADGGQRSDCPWAPESGQFALSCTAGPAGHAYCDKQCKNLVAAWSSGGCELDGCCRCTI